jgi:hypothetical protein
MKQPKQAHARRSRALDARALAPVTGGANTPQPWIVLDPDPQPWLTHLVNPEPSPW